MDKLGIISCKEYIQTKKEKLKEKITTLNKKPCLCVIQIGNNAASDSYIKGKKKDCEEVGIEFLHRHIENYETFSEERVMAIIQDLNDNRAIDGIIIQLPVPDKYNVDNLQKCISPEKDVDGFRRDSKFDPCTPKGIIDWLDYNEYDFLGKDAVVIGRSKIVGKPLVNMLIDKGATVTCCNSKTMFVEHYLQFADLIISAIGKPKYFDGLSFNCPEIIVDVGINRDKDGKLCGDIDRESVERVFDDTYVTPVPGGVGLLTRLALLENVVNATIGLC
jgi:methylenetetrahydrofolate dehydrogenase (NADP+)/methenyltetrahydrofolate cyclohydrolase